MEPGEDGRSAAVYCFGVGGPKVETVGRGGGGFPRPIVAGPLLQRRGTVAGTFWITVTGTLGLIPFALPGLLAQDWRLPWWAFVGVVYAGSAGGALGSLLWYGAVRRLGAARTAIYANMESLFAVLAATLLLGERVALTSVVGGAAVVAGVLLTRRRR